MSLHLLRTLCRCQVAPANTHGPHGAHGPTSVQFTPAPTYASEDSDVNLTDSVMLNSREITNPGFVSPGLASPSDDEDNVKQRRSLTAQSLLQPLCPHSLHWHAPKPPPVPKALRFLDVRVNIRSRTKMHFFKTCRD